MLTSSDDNVREWLTLAAFEAEFFGLIVTAQRVEVAMSLLMRQACQQSAAAQFDVVVADQSLPGISGIGNIVQMKTEPVRRPFMARLISPGEDVARAVLEEGFDLFAPMPDSLPSLTSLFRTIGQRFIQCCADEHLWPTTHRQA